MRDFEIVKSIQRNTKHTSNSPATSNLILINYWDGKPFHNAFAQNTPDSLSATTEIHVILCSFKFNSIYDLE